jgi:predicted AAA+ superfamily ATPase
MLGVRDLITFRRFLSLVASRHGQILNKSDLAAPLGLSVPTIGSWLEILEATAQVIVVRPYFENFGKRLLKTPKIYVGDSGLACHLLGIRSAAELERSPFLGALWEGFVASEIVKSQVNQGRRKELYFFRDEQALEVDFVFAGADGQLWMMECKASRTVHPRMADPLVSLHKAMKGKPAKLLVVHRSTPSAPPTSAVRPGVEALDLGAFVRRLKEKARSGRVATKARLGRAAQPV